MKRDFLLLSVIGFILLVGCSTQYSTLKPKTNGIATAYFGDIDEMMNDLHLSMLMIFPGRDITIIDGTGARGYRTYTRFMLDTYDQQAIFIPVKGITDDGAEVDAYAFMVSGSGSSAIVGRSANDRLYRSTKEILDAKYIIVQVK